MRKIKLCTLVLAACFCMGCSSNLKDGISFLEEGKFEEAIECFQEDVENEKRLDEAYRGLGIAYFELEDYEKAMEAFEGAVKNETEESSILYSLMGASSLHLENYEDALEYYEKALEEKDCTEELKQEILYNMISIYEKMGDWDTVKEKVEAYVEAYPEDTSLEKTIEFLETR